MNHQPNFMEQLAVAQQWATETQRRATEAENQATADTARLFSSEQRNHSEALRQASEAHLQASKALEQASEARTKLSNLWLSLLLVAALPSAQGGLGTSVVPAPAMSGHGATASPPPAAPASTMQGWMLPGSSIGQFFGPQLGATQASGQGVSSFAASGQGTHPSGYALTWSATANSSFGQRVPPASTFQTANAFASHAPHGLSLQPAGAPAPASSLQPRYGTQSGETQGGMAPVYVFGGSGQGPSFHHSGQSGATPVSSNGEMKPVYVFGEAGQGPSFHQSGWTYPNTPCVHRGASSATQASGHGGTSPVIIFGPQPSGESFRHFGHTSGGQFGTQACVQGGAFTARDDGPKPTETCKSVGVTVASTPTSAPFFGSFFGSPPVGTSSASLPVFGSPSAASESKSGGVTVGSTPTSLPFFGSPTVGTSSTSQPLLGSPSAASDSKSGGVTVGSTPTLLSFFGSPTVGTSSTSQPVFGSPSAASTFSRSTMPTFGSQPRVAAGLKSKATGDGDDDGEYKVKRMRK